MILKSGIPGEVNISFKDFLVGFKFCVFKDHKAPHLAHFQDPARLVLRNFGLDTAGMTWVLLRRLTLFVQIYTGLDP